MREISEVKACPGCGSYQVTYSNPVVKTGRKYWLLGCEDCGLNTGLTETKKEATDIWNTRHGETALLDKVLYAIETRQECVEFEGGGRALAILRKDVEAMNGGEV